MQEYLELFYQNREKIETFIEHSIKNVGILELNDNDFTKELYKTFISLELVYIVDCHSKQQLSSNIYAQKEDPTQLRKDRSYLFPQLKIKANSFSFSTPYHSSATKNLCISVGKREGDKIIFMDFNLEQLLMRLGLIERHVIFSNITKLFYMLAGSFMMLLSLGAIVYAGFDFTKNIVEGALNIDTIFKPVIATTLGLAIFDLAKTLLEQEVVFKSYLPAQSNEVRVLTKFLITVLIALSIETLMVVFKIAIENYEKMINALYLMGGVFMIIVAVAVLIFVSKK